MEELHRTHADVPFGWLLALQALAAKLTARRQARDPWRKPTLGAPACDLRNMAAPH